MEQQRGSRNSILGDANEKAPGCSASFRVPEIRRREPSPSRSTRLPVASPHPPTSANKSDQRRLRWPTSVEENTQFSFPTTAGNLRETSAVHPGQNLNRRRSQSVSTCVQFQQVEEPPRKRPEVSRSISGNRVPSKSGAKLPHRPNSVGHRPLSAANDNSRRTERLEVELTNVRQQLHDRIENFEKERQRLRADYHAERSQRIDAIVRAESAEERIRRLEQELHKVRLAYDMKEIELRTAREEIFNLKGRIRLCVRIRPLLSGESRSVPSHINVRSSHSVEVTHRGCSVVCECQHAWEENQGQAEVFDDVKDFIQSALHGYNVAVIAYGQTGSGKTYTMRGDEGDRAGIVPRSFDMLFRSIANLSSIGWQIEMTLSVFEIYLGRCFDLLAEEGRRQFTLHFVDGTADFRELTTVPIFFLEQAIEWINCSDELRSRASTKSSQFSSRGHTIVRITINSSLARSQKEYESCLSFVDLAGSERIGESALTGERLEETKFINKSLSQLGIVLRAQLKNSKYVPYMSDPLTKALAESLGAGSSRTMFIANIRPNSEAAFESLRTIEFSNQAMQTTIGEAVISRRQEASYSQQPVHG